MTKDKLLKAIKNPEWTNVEFKLCRNGVAEDAYKTVSAFSNTSGGYIIFGIRENANGTEREIVGVENVDRVQNDFLSCLRSSSKLSRVIYPKAILHELDGKHILVFYIPEANREEKPIYLDRRIDQAYIRRGGGDELCTETELRSFIRDASVIPFDRVLEQGIIPDKFINTKTLKWYRKLYDDRTGNRYASFDDIDFLLELGLMTENEDKVVPTKAAILLFGKERYVRQILPRPIVDYQRIDTFEENWDPDKRWHDRLVIESNLFDAWRVLYDKYSLIADVPFSLDETTMLRKDDSLEYRSFREAAVNLLIHQDYGDISRKAEIKIFRDKTVFWNPGSAYSSVEELLESRHHPTRNPLIVRIFRLIGLCEEAGTGIRTIMEDCRKLGLFPAQIINDKSGFSFSLTILKQQIISEPFKELIARLDIKTNADEDAIFSYLVAYKNLSLPIAKAITGKSSDVTLAAMAKLEAAGLTKSSDHKQAWSLSEHIEQQIIKTDSAQATDQATGQVTGQATGQAHENKKQEIACLIEELTQVQIGIIRICSESVSMKEIMQNQSKINRDYLRVRHLNPLLRQGIVLMKYPDKPKHPMQKYHLSDYGSIVLQTIQGES
ncbi:MAG: putative DNA binding domain-containing protein [Candidatus Cloacimonetes bacterium]|nr:putative DNA binding domain-containing protein [Candidatus Cloacimonadota bacterium]